MATKIEAKINESEELLREVNKLDTNLYLGLLDDYSLLVFSLKCTNDASFWDKLIDTQEHYSKFEARLPNVSNDEFEEYVVLSDLLGELYEVSLWNS